MGIVREPEGVDFVVSSGRWSPEVSAEVAEFLRQVRLQAKSSPTTVTRLEKDADTTKESRSELGPIVASS